MDKVEQSLFEAAAILNAHVDLMQRLTQAQWSDSSYVANIRAQLERVDVAHKAFLALPRPEQQQKAA